MKTTKRSKGLAVLLFAVFLLPLTAYGLEIEKEAVVGTIIKELNTPAVFNLTIKNNGPADNFIIDTLLGITFQPTNSFSLGRGEEKSILLKAFFNDELKRQYTGNFEFAYYIKGFKTGITDDTLKINIVPLEEAVNVVLPETVGMRDEKLIIDIENEENIILDAIIKIDSELFDAEEEISLVPNEKRQIEINLDKEKIWKQPGVYPVSITITAGNYRLRLERDIKLLEYTDVSVEEKKINLLFFKKITITKTITGNVVQEVTTELEKNSFEKAFTSFNTEPSSVQEEADGVVYTWEKDLGLGESLVVESTTNYILPLLFIILIGGGSLYYFTRNQKGVVIRKRVIKARAPTGEFVVKVVLTIKNAGEKVENMILTERLPLLTSLHERFGAIRPEKVEKDKLIYNIPEIEAGQTMALSYVAYSDVKFVGKRLLPKATASYKVNGMENYASSNEVFVMS